MKKEYIATSADGYNNICICGNEPIAEGFHPCDAEGKYAATVDTTLHLCDRCGKIINMETLEVVGMKSVDVKAKA